MSLPTGHLLAAVVTVLAGALACCALGFALTICVRTTNAASAVVQAALWILFFFSGLFIPMNYLHVAFRALADVFPVRHFFEATLTAFNPNVTGSGFAPGHLGVVALWGRRAGHRGLEIPVDPISRTVSERRPQPPAPLPDQSVCRAPRQRLPGAMVTAGGDHRLSRARRQVLEGGVTGPSCRGLQLACQQMAAGGLKEG